MPSKPAQNPFYESVMRWREERKQRRLLSALETIARNLGKNAGPNATPDTVASQTDPSPEAATTTLTANEAAVLRALRESKTLMNQADVEAATELSRRTVQECLKGLEDAGLVTRPRGARRGFSLTPTGQKIAP